MAVDVLTEIDIARSRLAVASFASDPSNATRWYRNIRSVIWETSPPLAVGSRVRVVLHVSVAGRALGFEAVVQWCAAGPQGFVHGLLGLLNVSSGHWSTHLSFT